jgi:argininosuccinate synthase
LGEATELKLDADGGWPLRSVNGSERFCDEIIVRAIKANACYEDGYFLSAALSRPLLATICSEQLRNANAVKLVHGLAGNDQLRFEMGLATLSPEIEIVSVASIIGSQASRNHHGFTESSNLWGSSIEAGTLADPWRPPEPELFQKLLVDVNSIAQPEIHTIRFEKGCAVALDGVEMSLLMIIKALRNLGRTYGVGCSDLVEDGYVGLKTRALYESAAALALITAHRDLERLVSTRLQNLFKPLVDKAWTELVYNGFWFDPQRTALESYIDNVNQFVSGEVRLLYKPGNVAVVGRTSEFAIYDDDQAIHRVGQDMAVNGISELAALKSVQMKAAAARIRSRRLAARSPV